MKTGRIKNSIILAIVALLFISCDPNQVYEQNIELTDYSWHKDSVKVFEVAIEDTINLHNIYVNVRNTSQYAMQNLFLFIHTTAPSGMELDDKFECYLADERGKWTGNGWGNLYDNQFIYKRNIQFPVSGIYTIRIKQGMRTSNLKYISDIGVRVEKVELQ